MLVIAGSLVTALKESRIPEEAWAQGSPSRPPSNTTSLVAGGFISALRVSDIRFELSVYGDFFNDIPRRLGVNEALDASVAAMSTAFETIQTRQRPAEVYAQYGKALRALRISLNDSTKAESPETLCAIWLILICQVRPGRVFVTFDLVRI